jgi:hypothetical protein
MIEEAKMIPFTQKTKIRTLTKIDIILVKVLADPQETLGLNGDSRQISFTSVRDLFMMFSNPFEAIFAPQSRLGVYSSSKWQPLLFIYSGEGFGGVFVESN